MVVFFNSQTKKSKKGGGGGEAKDSRKFKKFIERLNVSYPALECIAKGGSEICIPGNFQSFTGYDPSDLI